MIGRINSLSIYDCVRLYAYGQFCVKRDQSIPEIRKSPPNYSKGFFKKIKPCQGRLPCLLPHKPLLFKPVCVPSAARGVS